jgi:hypothetical protein
VSRACGTHEREKCTTFWCENPQERGHLEDRGIDERMGLEWILGRWTGRASGMDSVRSGQGPVAGACERGDEPSGSDATELMFIPPLLHTHSSVPAPRGVR